MTSSITLSCPEGIVLAADRRCTILLGDGAVKFKENIDKIFPSKKIQAGYSCWGQASIDGVDIEDHLEKFEAENVVKTDDVNTVAGKLWKHLESLQKIDDLSMGIHVAGYCKDKESLYPQIRHVFHEKWYGRGKFTNENSNEEYHLPDGQKKQYKYDPFIALYNGERAVANAYFDLLPKIYPNKARIILDLLSLDQCIRLARQIIITNGELLDFVHTLDQKKPIQSVHGIAIAKITKEKGFEWVERSYVEKEH